MLFEIHAADCNLLLQISNNGALFVDFKPMTSKRSSLNQMAASRTPHLHFLQLMVLTDYRDHLPMGKRLLVIQYCDVIFNRVTTCAEAGARRLQIIFWPTMTPKKTTNHCSPASLTAGTQIHCTVKGSAGFRRGVGAAGCSTTWLEWPVPPSSCVTFESHTRDDWSVTSVRTLSTRVTLPWDGVWHGVHCPLWRQATASICNS